MATKKSAAKKIGAKKSPSKKVVAKKAKSKTKSAASIPKAIMPSDAFDGIPDNVDCICMQKNPNGKFYNFKLQEGRWVQASAIPFPTKEICEDACC